MKFQMNFTTSYDDVIRFTSADDLQHFYMEHGCTGLEVMPLGYYERGSGCIFTSGRVPTDPTGYGNRNPLLLQWRLGES